MSDRRLNSCTVVATAIRTVVIIKENLYVDIRAKGLNEYFVSITGTCSIYNLTLWCEIKDHWWGENHQSTIFCFTFTILFTCSINKFTKYLMGLFVQSKINLLQDICFLHTVEPLLWDTSIKGTQTFAPAKLMLI